MDGRLHCSPADLLGVADGSRPEADVSHLSACAACRQEVIELRRILEAARQDEVPEPSPLFWQQLERRVREAVASDGCAIGPVRSAPWTRLRSNWWVALTTAAGIVLAVFMARGGERRTPVASPAVAQTTTVAEVTAPSAVVLANNDSSLAWMAELASSLDQEAIEGSGLAIAAGAADVALAELTSDEQRELERLLRDEMQRPGA